MRPPFDGWIDERAARPIQEGERTENSRDVEMVRQTIASFRGHILSEAYALEGALETLIVRHLFRDRQDGMAAFFEDTVLRESGFGLDRKVRICRKIVEHWSEHGDEAKALSGLLETAKQCRNRVAHWPTRLVPLLSARDRVPVDYSVYIVKEEQEFLLDADAQTTWIKTIVEARAKIEILANNIARYSRSGLE